MKYFQLIFIWCILIGTGCSTTRFVEPLEEKQIAITGDLGGPLFELGGLKIPMPFTSVGVGYGLKDNLTVFGGLQVTSLIYKTLQVDVGMRQRIYESQKPAVPSLSYGVVANAMTNFRSGDFRFFPELALSPYWKYGNWKTYLNGQFWLDFYPDNGVNTNGYLVPAIAIGQSYTRENWAFTIEYKRLAPNLNEDYTVVNYLTNSGRGGNGIYFSIIKFL